jgi:phage tail-like protein
MPEYLAPGVYVEEASLRSRPIEGVSIGTAGFAGPTRDGPADLGARLVTGMAEFESIYGDGRPLDFASGAPNYMWHAARAFFEEGGKRLYIARIVSREAKRAGASLTGTTGSSKVNFFARWPGKAGERRVRLALSMGRNILGSEHGRPTVRTLQDRDIVWIKSEHGAAGATTSRLYLARVETDAVAGSREKWRFHPLNDAHRAIRLSKKCRQIRVVTMAITLLPRSAGDAERTWTDLPLDPQHRRRESNLRDSFADVFAQDPPDRAQAAELPVCIALENVRDGLDVLKVLRDATVTAGNGQSILNGLSGPHSRRSRTQEFPLEGGTDGPRPGLAEYQGEDQGTYKTGLPALEHVPEIAVVAAPGSTGLHRDENDEQEARGIASALISHAERMRYRIAVLDSGSGQSIAAVRAMRAALDSQYAALYYPWVRVFDPISRSEVVLPPSGFVAGIYARSDIERGVHQAPANQVVRLALGLEATLNQAECDVLNSEGINCFRFFEGREYRLWGTRTISSDPEWQYVNLRRYAAYLEHSIDRGTQWVVFEPNGEALWADVRRTIEDFLLNEWQSGALLGAKPEEAFFVRCDRSTMTQDDLDNGRLICVIGIAPLRPAEFVIFRIGQWTAAHKPWRRRRPPKEEISMAVRRDNPYAQFNFLVDLGAGSTGGAQAGFQEISGFDIEATMAEHHSSGEEGHAVRKITGINKAGDVTLKRGVIESASLQQWLDQIHNGHPAALRTVVIQMQNEDHAIVQTWKLVHARIIKHSSGPLNAKGTDVAVEELVLAYERLELE